jgi:hypothetical protein
MPKPSAIARFAAAAVLGAFAGGCGLVGTPTPVPQTTSLARVPERTPEARAGAAGNAIFLDHGFMVNAMPDAQIRRVVRWLAQRKFAYQFQNVTALNADGTIKPENYSQLAHWIAVSRAADPKQRIVVYISGSLNLVNDPSTWQNVAAVCRMFFRKYGVDGINLDFEPYRTGTKNYVGCSAPSGRRSGLPPRYRWITPRT